MANLLLQFVEELEKGEEGRPYDFICNNAWRMSKDQLKAIAKECLCVACDNSFSRSACYDDIAENIREWYETELED